MAKVAGGPRNPPGSGPANSSTSAAVTPSVFGPNPSLVSQPVAFGPRTTTPPSLQPHHSAPSIVQTTSTAPTAPSTSPDKNEQENLKKRKRVYSQEEEDEWRRAIRRKLDDERRLLDETANPDQANKDLYMLYNELQGLSNEYTR